MYTEHVTGLHTPMLVNPDVWPANLILRLLPVPNREEPEYEAMASTNENSDLNAGGLDTGKQI